jgi:hypothetical protein
MVPFWVLHVTWMRNLTANAGEDHVSSGLAVAGRVMNDCPIVRGRAFHQLTKLPQHPLLIEPRKQGREHQHGKDESGLGFVSLSFDFLPITTSQLMGAHCSLPP